ncbi:hypothetical protein B296_00010016 [Ensete ventricosum]|uniref:Uncharacterized protein n=1 Tax=Ensete ventricosum TaxID=4639 RepID=A0A427B282_ENSVE|nr:hypothetical protein B296_00010016 [Ensete ventricosum]
MKVSNILSLLPPSDARPACISTAMASTTWRSLPTGVSHASSNSLTSVTACPQRHRLPTLWLTSAAAIAHVTTAHPTANPRPTFPINPPPKPRIDHSIHGPPRAPGRGTTASEEGKEMNPNETAEETNHGGGPVPRGRVLDGAPKRSLGSMEQPAERVKRREESERERERGGVGG